MANTLLITKESGGYFSFVLNGDTAKKINSTRNDLLTVGDECHFKTTNGANLVKEQLIYPEDITLIASGTFTFTNVTDLFTKLIEVNFFDWIIGGGGGGSGVNRFDELNDTFQYFGKGGQVLVVRESEVGLETVEFNNISSFTELSDTPDTLVANKMVVVSPTGNSLILKDQPPAPTEYLNSLGYFSYDDTSTQPPNALDTAILGHLVKIPNNTLGLETNTTENPYGVSSMFNASNNSIDFSQLSVGDQVIITQKIQIISTGLANVDILLWTDDVNDFKITIGNYDIPNNTVVSATTELFVTESMITKPLFVYVYDTTETGLLFLINKGLHISVLKKNVNVIDVNVIANLSATHFPDKVEVRADDGDNAVLLPATVSNAGLLLPDEKTKIAESAPLESPIFTGNPTAPTPTLGDDSESIATTEFVQEALTSLSGTETRVPINDANYIIATAATLLIAYTSITADRTVTLPAATTANQRIRIVDESFSCGGSRRILIAPNGSDTISGGINSVINFPGGAAYFQSNGSGKWITLSTTAIQLSAGVNTLPTITDNGDGSITIGNGGVYTLFANTDGSGRPKSYGINGGTFVMSDGVVNHIIAKYDPTTATTSVFSSTNFNDVNHISSIQIFSVFRQGLVIFSRNNDRLGLALSNKLQRNAELTGDFRVNSGTLLLGESATRVITIGAGTAWIGGNEIPLGAVNSTSNNCFFVQQTAPGVWSTSTLDTQYRNTQYNPASGGLSTLTNGRYAVIFVFRSLGQGNSLAYCLGQGDYTLGEAQLAKRPTNLPLIITSQMLPVGRIIVLKSANSATQIDKISDESYAFSGVTDHEALTNLLGGDGTGHYHFTSAEKTTFYAIPTTYKSILTGMNFQGGNYPLTLADSSKRIVMSSNSSANLVLYDYATVPFPVGTVIEYTQTGTGPINLVTFGASIISNLGNLVSVQGETRRLTMTNINVWTLEGTPVSANISPTLTVTSSRSVAQTDLNSVLIVGASITLTIPNTGLSTDFECSFAVRAGFTLTFALAGGVTVIMNAGLTQLGNTTSTLKRIGATNEFILHGEV